MVVITDIILQSTILSASKNILEPPMTDVQAYHFSGGYHSQEQTSS